MISSLWDLEIHADYARQRAEAFAAQRVPAVPVNRSAGPRLALVRVRRGAGRGLIAAGERLVGSAAPRPAPSTHAA